jgi:hypothetical protein
MSGISYVALVERPTGVVHRFFTNRRARTDSPKTVAEAEAWITTNLQEHGTVNVRCSLSKVVWSIEG